MKGICSHLLPPWGFFSKSSRRATIMSTCGIVQPVDIEGVAAGLVRSGQNTKEGGNWLEPICPASCGIAEDVVCGSEGELVVPFDTRTYLLTAYDGQCAGRTFGTPAYDCVDYEQGAIFLGGKTLSFDIDLRGIGCGCNAALYLVSMPQNGDTGLCAGDGYCDANSVCGVECTELDLMEANQVAWVSTVHVADDGNGEGFGYGHYVQASERRLTSEDECAYGPAAFCTINTLLPFHAQFAFSAAGEPFSFTVTLEQEGRTAATGPVAYGATPSKGAVASAEDANAALRASLDAGMTMVASYWSGSMKKDMSWMDSQCYESEISEWGCTDVWVDHPEWPFLCSGTDESPPHCDASAGSYRMSNFLVQESPSPPPPPAPPLTFEQGFTDGFADGMLTGVGASALIFAVIVALVRRSGKVRPTSAQSREQSRGRSQADDVADDESVEVSILMANQPGDKVVASNPDRPASPAILPY